MANDCIEQFFFIFHFLIDAVSIYLSLINNKKMNENINPKKFLFCLYNNFIQMTLHYF